MARASRPALVYTSLACPVAWGFKARSKRSRKGDLPLFASSMMEKSGFHPDSGIAQTGEPGSAGIMLLAKAERGPKRSASHLGTQSPSQARRRRVCSARQDGQNNGGSAPRLPAFTALGQ